MVTVAEMSPDSSAVACPSEFPAGFSIRATVSSGWNPLPLRPSWQPGAHSAEVMRRTGGVVVVVVVVVVVDWLIAVAMTGEMGDPDGAVVVMPDGALLLG